MIDALRAIFGVLVAIGQLVLWALVSFLNLLIAAIGAAIAALLALLPNMPATAGPPGGVLGAINWVVPLGPLLAGFALIVALWTSFLVIRIALKWVKAL